MFGCEIVCGVASFRPSTASRKIAKKPLESFNAVAFELWLDCIDERSGVISMIAASCSFVLTQAEKCATELPLRRTGHHCVLGSL